jgi:hypothetical protein
MPGIDRHVFAFCLRGQGRRSRPVGGDEAKRGGRAVCGRALELQEILDASGKT